MMRREIYKEYIPTNKENTYIKIEVYYHKGDYNIRRGYYLSVQPIEKEGVWEKFTAYTGYMYELFPCERYTKAGRDKAVGLKDGILQSIIERICKEQDITVA